MKYVDEYRDQHLAQKAAAAIASTVTRPWTVMEICGGQTHAILKYGIDALLPKEVSLVHGPGCPVCVTPLEAIDQAVMIASQPNVIFCSFGDMVRVPGSKKDLLAVKAEGHDVRIVYSPLDAVVLARDNPDKRVVFFAVGFETTAPATAMAAYQAREEGIKNFFLLASHVLVPPAIKAILSAPDNLIQGFLAAGHVCTVMGYTEYEPIAEEFKVPIVVTGFEPLDILQGMRLCLRMLEDGRYGVENEYGRIVTRAGNPEAQRIIREVFQVVDRKWRGIGEIPKSGWALREEFSGMDARKVFNVSGICPQEPKECIAGLVLQGIRKPFTCAAFGKACTPQHPLGAPMVSSEGACAAYYRYRKIEGRGEKGDTKDS